MSFIYIEEKKVKYPPLLGKTVNGRQDISLADKKGVYRTYSSTQENNDKFVRKYNNIQRNANIFSWASGLGFTGIGAASSPLLTMLGDSPKAKLAVGAILGLFTGCMLGDLYKEGVDKRQYKLTQDYANFLNKS